MRACLTSSLCRPRDQSRSAALNERCWPCALDAGPSLRFKAIDEHAELLDLHIRGRAHRARALERGELTFRAIVEQQIVRQADEHRVRRGDAQSAWRSRRFVRPHSNNCRTSC